MLRKISAALLIVLFIGAPAFAAKKREPKFKSVEVKHFSRAEGVELSAQFSDYLYAELREDLKKESLFEEIVGENETVDPAQAAKSFVIDGSLIEFRKGNVAKQVLIGFGAGLRSLRVKVNVQRRSDNSSILDTELKVKSSATMKEQVLAKLMAKKIKGELNKALGKI